MRQYSIIFFIRQSLRGLFMNSIMSITSVFILTSCLLLTGSSVLLIINADLNLKRLDSLNKIVFFIDKDHESEEALAKIQAEIDALANTKSWRFISKEEAFENLREQYESFASVFDSSRGLLADVIRDNPLRHTIEIEYKDINDVGTLVYQLNTIEGRAKINNQVETAELVRNIQNIIMLVMLGFLAILFIVPVFIILSTVRLSVHARRQEIIIMRYIGATNFFILFPFLLEGIIIGVVSAVIAYITQSYIYNGAVRALLGIESGMEFIAFPEVNAMLFAGFLFTGVLCGLFGSGLSSRKYLEA